MIGKLVRAVSKFASLYAVGHDGKELRYANKNEVFLVLNEVKYDTPSIFYIVIDENGCIYDAFSSNFEEFV